MSTAIGIWSLLCVGLGAACDDLSLVAPAMAETLSEASDGTIALPSGLVVSRQETRLEPVGAPTHGVRTVRLRYVSPQLEEDDFPFERIEEDFSKLCTVFGLKTREQSAPQAEQVIISISSAPTDFGATAPSVIQYFDAFRVDDSTCIWEGL